MDVGHLAERKAEAAHLPDDQQGRTDEATVPNKAGPGEDESGRILHQPWPVEPDIVELRASDPADHGREYEVPGPVGIEPVALHLGTQQEAGGQERQQHHDPERSYGLTAEDRDPVGNAEEDGKHGFGP